LPEAPLTRAVLDSTLAAGRALKLNVRLTPRSEWLIGKGYGRPGADISPLLDPDDIPEIPWSTMRGLAREAARSLATWYPAFGGAPCGGSSSEPDLWCRAPLVAPCPICRVFGSPLQRGSWEVGDLRYPDALRNRIGRGEQAPGPVGMPEGPLGQATRVGIHGELGRASKHHVRTEEMVHSTWALEGVAEERYPLQADPSNRFLDLLLMALSLRLVQRLGSHRRRGWGWVQVDVDLDDPVDTLAPATLIGLLREVGGAQL